MNNTRKDTSHVWFNESEVAQQVSEQGDINRNEHIQAYVAKQQNALTDLKAKVAAGHMTEEEMQAHLLMKRIDKTFQHEHHEDRWQRQHNAYEKVREMDSKMDQLNRKYRAGKVDDATYWQRIAKYSQQAEEAKKEL